jgi:hypothetical protein
MYRRQTIPKKMVGNPKKENALRDMPDFYTHAGKNPKKLSLIPQNGL